MLNGLLKILSYALGVIRLWKDLKDVILWLVFVVKAFVTCVVNLGNLIIKIISNATFIKRRVMMKLADRKQFSKN